MLQDLILATEICQFTGVLELVCFFSLYNDL